MLSDYSLLFYGILLMKTGCLWKNKNFLCLNIKLNATISTFERLIKTEYMKNPYIDFICMYDPFSDILLNQGNIKIHGKNKDVEICLQ